MPSIKVKDADGNNQVVQSLPAVGQGAQVASLPVVLATDDPVVAATGTPAAAPYVTADGSAAGTLVGLLKGILVRLFGTLLVDTVIRLNPTDRSGTIATAGTAQQLMPANATRRGFYVQNQSSGDLWINGIAGATTAQPSLRIPSLAYYETPSTHSGTGAISIIGATAGQAFTSREW